MSDVSQTLQDFCALGSSAEDFRATMQTDQPANSTLLQDRLVEELIGLGTKKKALKVIKNLLLLGFALNIMQEVRNVWLYLWFQRR